MIHYRSELDGLRAVAVMPMVLFHAHYPGFTGGYVGVDIFLVVSGFLIASIMLSEKSAGNFSLLGFYERRARRILPALFFVMSATIMLSWVWMTPDQLALFAQSVLSVVFYVSNFFFWQQVDYFGPAAGQMPLLHTWSLAVEEQYYIFFPLVMLLIWKLGRQKMVWAIVLVTLASFALAQWASMTYPRANYYLTPTRVWELLLGVLAAFYLQKNGGLPRHQSDAMAVSGLLMIAYSVVAYDENTPFPSYYTLVPVTGTLLVILYGGASTFVGKGLSLKPVVMLGLLSYSIYLWHQPLFAFARIHGVSDESRVAFLLLIFLSIVLAKLTWSFVENPFRNKKKFSRRSIFGLAAGAATITSACAALAITTNIGELRWSPETLEILEYQSYPRQTYYREGECFLTLGQNYDAYSSDCMVAATEKSVLLWGDSHAAALQLGFPPDLDGDRMLFYAAAACPPILDLGGLRNRFCAEINQYVVGNILTSNIKQVVMHANWSFYKDSPDWPGKLAETIRMLNKHGIQVTVVGSVPKWEQSLPVIVARKMRNKRVPIDSLDPAFPVKEYSKLVATDSVLRRISHEEKVEFISVLDKVCAGGYCKALVRAEDGIKLLAWDNAHLTLEGSEYIAYIVSKDMAANLVKKSNHVPLQESIFQ